MAAGIYNIQVERDCALSFVVQFGFDTTGMAIHGYLKQEDTQESPALATYEVERLDDSIGRIRFRLDTAACNAIVPLRGIHKIMLPDDRGEDVVWIRGIFEVIGD